MQIHPDYIIGISIGLLVAFLWAISVNIYNSQADKIKPIAIAAMKMWFAVPVISFAVLWQIQTEPFLMPIESAFFLIGSVSLGMVVGDTLYLAGQERI